MNDNSQPQPKKVNNIRVTQSSQGQPIPVVMGQAKIQTSILDISPFTEQSVTSSGGGKGLGGGKNGGTAYNIFADIQAALCNGPVIQIGSAWSGESMLATNQTGDSVSITSNYSPSQQVAFTTDNGVSLVQTYSTTYTDYGVPYTNVQNGSTLAPMTAVPYNYSETPAQNNASLKTGQYSLQITTLGTFTVTSCGNASAGSTVYTGSFGTTAASSAVAGYNFTVAGFGNALNNGTFLCTASTSTTITLSNTLGVAETGTATASDLAYVYHFSSADVGSDAIINYQWNFSELEGTDVFLVPAGPGASGFPNYTIVLSQQYTPTGVTSVAYYGQDAQAGTTLTRVYSTPTVAGTYQVFAQSAGSSSNTYIQFSAADVGAEVVVDWWYTNQSAVGGNSGGSGGPVEYLNAVLYGGTMNQPVNTAIASGGTFSVLESTGSDTNFSGSDYSISVTGNEGEVLNYPGIAHIDYQPAYLGDSGTLDNNTFEVITPDAYGGGVVDCNPIQCILRVLTDTRWGLGNNFPTQVIDNGGTITLEDGVTLLALEEGTVDRPIIGFLNTETSYGTWGGSSGTPGAMASGSTAYNWCASNNLFISPVIDSQESAASVMGKWLEGTMLAAFMSEGLMKLVPYGSTSTTANGVTWVAPQTYVAEFDDTSFVDDGDGGDRLKISSKEWVDCFNWVYVDFDNRANQYCDDMAQAFDMSSINKPNGRLDEDPQDWDFFHTSLAAQSAASLRVNRMVSDRNTFEWKTSYAFNWVECMDICLLSTQCVWSAGLNNVQLNMLNFPVRITEKVTNTDGTISWTAETYIPTAQQATVFNASTTSGNSVNMFASPGNTLAIMFEATSRLTNYQGNQIWIGACGTTTNWGSCNIYVSQDGDTYLLVGTVSSAARIGTLAQNFPSSGTQVVSQSYTVSNALTTGGALSQWTVGNTIAIPNTVEFDCTPTGGIVDVLLFASTTSGKPNGYMFRFDARSGQYPGQILKIASGTWTSVGTASGSVNPVALTSGTYTVAGTVEPYSGGGFQFNIYINGYLYCTYHDTTYTPTGVTYYGYEVEASPVIAPTYGSDPSNADDLVVVLEENCPALDSGTTQDADSLNTMCFVDGEIISYSTCTPSGQNQYTMSNYMRRGQVGSQILPHVAGAAFMRLDSSIFKFSYDPQWAGQTLFLKFQSVNRWGKSPQALSAIEPVVFTVPGLGPGSIDAASGITINQTSFNIGAGPFGTTPAAIT